MKTMTISEVDASVQITGKQSDRDVVDSVRLIILNFTQTKMTKKRLNVQ